jgi:hypothetical protein
LRLRHLCACFSRKTISPVKRWTASDRGTDGRNRLRNTGVRFLRFFAEFFRRAFLTLQRTFPILQRVFLTLQRVFLSLQRAFLILQRAFPSLQHAFLTLRRAFPALRRVFPTLRRAPQCLLRAPPDRNGDRCGTRFRANESTVYEYIYLFKIKTL